MVNNRETGKLKQIEKILKTTFVKLAVPTGPEVCQKQLLALMHKVHEVKVNEAEIAAFLPAVYEELKDLDKNELIKRFASIEFNRFLEYYRNAPDLNADSKGTTRDMGGAERYSTGDRYFINLGKMDELDVPTLLELLDDCCGITKKNVGKIDLKGAYSFFEVDKEKSADVIKGFEGMEFAGRIVRVELTEGGGGGRSRERSGRSEGNRSESGSRERGGRNEGNSRERSVSGQRSGYGNREGRNRGAGSSGSSNRPGNFERRGNNDRRKRY